MSFLRSKKIVFFYVRKKEKRLLVVQKKTMGSSSSTANESQVPRRQDGGKQYDARFQYDRGFVSFGFDMIWLDDRR